MTWAFCHVGPDGDRIYCERGVVPVRLLGTLATNNVAEFVAILKALESLPDGWSGDVYSDSKNTLGRFFWGWANRGIPETWLARAVRAKNRLGPLTPTLLDGHPTSEHLAASVGKRGGPVSAHNVHCDTACHLAAADYLREGKERTVGEEA